MLLSHKFYRLSINFLPALYLMVSGFFFSFSFNLYKPEFILLISLILKAKKANSIICFYHLVYLLSSKKYYLDETIG